MNKTDFMAYVAKNVQDMKDLQLKYKYRYDKNDRQEIFKVARKISRYNKMDVDEVKRKINDKDIASTFLSSLEILDSKKIIDFFKNHLDNIKIIRQRCVEQDEAILEYDTEKDKEPVFRINLPRTGLTVTNQLGFAHEMGHIPEIVKPRPSFLEQSEVVPLFFEYLTAHECIKGEDWKYAFLDERLSMTIDEALSIIKLFDKCDMKEHYQSLYFTQRFADRYSLLESFDYALQLIDIFEQDKGVVTREIEKIIKGKSLKDVANNLSIDSSGCKRLLKEYKDEGY